MKLAANQPVSIPQCNLAVGVLVCVVGGLIRHMPKSQFVCLIRYFLLSSITHIFYPVHTLIGKKMPLFGKKHDSRVVAKYVLGETLGRCVCVCVQACVSCVHPCGCVYVRYM